MKTHELKTCPDFYAKIVSGEKTFEYRKNDRNFQVGDILILREYIPVSNTYTGKSTACQVTYILPVPNAFPIRDNYVILSIKKNKVLKASPPVINSKGAHFA